MSSQPRDRRLLAYAREMRKNMTPEEGKLWCLYLRKHPRFRFRRQEIIGSYIADFYCAQAKLIIEIDGSQHYDPQGIAYDKSRAAYLESLGLQIIRFSNADINVRFAAVCEQIHKVISLSVSCADSSPKGGA